MKSVVKIVLTILIILLIIGVCFVIGFSIKELIGESDYQLLEGIKASIDNIIF